MQRKATSSWACPRLAGDGHNAAFDALAVKFHKWMLVAAATVLKSHEDVEDATQEAWVKVWGEVRKGGLRELECDVPAYLWTVARSSARDYLKRRYALKRGGRDVGMFTYEVLRELHGLHRWRRHGSDCDMKERTAPGDPLRSLGMLHRMATQLPPEHLATLDAFYFKSDSLEALARRLSTTTDRVKRLLCDGIQLLRMMAEEAMPAEYAEFEEMQA